MNVNAAKIVRQLLEAGDVEMAHRVAARLNLEFKPVQFPYLDPQWQFTYLGKGPAEGATFYTRAGATEFEIEERWRQVEHKFIQGAR